MNWYEAFKTVLIAEPGISVRSFETGEPEIGERKLGISKEFVKWNKMYLFQIFIDHFEAVDFKPLLSLLMES